MNSSLKLFVATLSLYCAYAYAIPPCDCTAAGWVGECSATLQIKGTWVKVFTNTQQCSRVDWFVDDEKISQMTIVLNGAEVEDFSPKKPKSVVVQSCKICKDNRIQRPSHSDSSIPQVGDSQRRQTPSRIAGIWTGNAQNSMGYNQQIVLRVSQRQGSQIQVVSEGKTSGTSWSESGEGSFDGKIARYTLKNGAVQCVATLVSEDQMRKECSGHGTSSSGMLTREQ
jgi:hypothetical protein